MRILTPALGLLLALRLLPGCSDASIEHARGEGGSGSDDAEAPADAEETDSGTSEEDGGARDAGASRDAAIHAADAGLDAQAHDDRLQPFELGRRWTYTRSAIDGAREAGCSAPLESFIGDAQVERDGQVGWEYHPVCNPGAVVQMFLSGDDIWAFQDNSPARIDYAKAPVEEGFSWNSSGIGYVWHDAGTVKVPAGSFDGCWRRSPDDAGGYIVLCRGVGLVAVESQTQNYHVELESKNF